MVLVISNEQEASTFERHASSHGELAIGIALFLGANRELDSGISIKRIVSHPFQFNLSHKNKEMFQIVKQEWR